MTNSVQVTGPQCSSSSSTTNAASIDDTRQDHDDPGEHIYIYDDRYIRDTLADADTAPGADNMLTGRYPTYGIPVRPQGSR